ncbi:hypothetical protein ACFL27_06055 [candidate division CSSED10-310 bacterium]|uniref:Uncharacterized protein n=1 Tax=candidate division CSSED10-310 bacterium TaxID=2855610 RepID=A0ABV6YU75_UNCC1
MNCYRCGFDYTGAQCLICGKLAPTDDNPAGDDAQELRIAVLIPPDKVVSEQTLTGYRQQAEHYQFCPNGAQRQHVFVYTPTHSKALFRLLQETESVRERQILFNGRRRPYASDLWLPLLWYLSH